MLYNSLNDSILVVLLTNNQQMKVHGLRAAIFGAIKNQAVSVPKKSAYLEVREKMLADIGKGLAYYNQLKALHQDTYDFSFELGDLLSSGKFLQRRKNFDDAIHLFEIAVKLEGRPSDISYGYELMADTYFKIVLQRPYLWNCKYNQAGENP